MGIGPGLWGIETEAQHLASLVTRDLPVTVASVALWDEPTLALTVKAVDTVRPVDRPLPVGVRVPLAALTWHRIAFEQGEPILLESGDDRQRDVEREADLALIPNIRSMYLLPIRFAGETVGVLVLGEARAAAREPFSAEKRRRCQAILEEFVAATAPAWEAWRLRRQVRAMSSLIQLVRGVSTARSYDDVLRSLAAEVANWLGIPVRGSLLGMMDGEIHPLARWQLPEEVLSDGGRQLLLAMTRSDGRESGPVTVTVAGDDPLDPLAAAQPEARNWTRIGLPLMRDERVIGVACLYLEDEVRLVDWELEALRRRGEIVALGVEAVETALVVEADRERLHRLASALLTGYRRALLQEVFAGLTRTLSGPLERRLRESLPALVDRGRTTGETGADQLDLVSAVVAEVSAVFADLWEANGHPEPSTMSLDVNDIVNRALRIAKTGLEDLARRRGVKVEVRFDPAAQPVLIEGSLVLIGALVHVIESAAEAMPEGGEIVIRTSRENGHGVISVEDTGSQPLQGPEPAPLPRFSVTHPSVALSVLQSVVRSHGGQATVLPREAWRTALELHLPASSSAEAGR